MSPAPAIASPAAPTAAGSAPDALDLALAAPSPPSPRGAWGAVDRAAARRVLAAAAALGLLGEWLLWDAAPGVNVPLFTLAGVAAVVALGRARGRPVTVGAALLAALAVALAACVAWRDALPLVGLDLVALGTVACALARAAWLGDALPIERAGPGDYVRAGVAVAADVAAAGPALVAGPARFDRAAEGDRSALARGLAGARRAARGVVLAALPLAVFGLLFVAADAAFARLVSRILAADVMAVVGHLGRGAVGAWLCAGYLAAAALGGRRAMAAATASAAGRPPRPAAGGWTAADVCVALALVDALFVAFVFVQLGWLFGGAEVVGRPGVTYAEYARRGFFELTAAATLVLPLLLVAESLVAQSERRGQGGPPTRAAFRVLSATLLALVAVLVASAVDRMRLYTGAYGLTELRLYVLAFIAWLASVLAWAAATLLRGRAAAFALGALLSGWAWVLALNVANPAAWVVRVNVARAERGAEFDVAHVATLGADALPAFVDRGLPAVVRRGDGAEACAALAALRLHALGDTAREGAWREWNVGRTRAAGARRRAAAGAARAVLAERCPAGRG